MLARRAWLIKAWPSPRMPLKRLIALPMRAQIGSAGVGVLPGHGVVAVSHGKEKVYGSIP